MENIMLTALNFSKICRVCLMECESMFSIFSELFEDNSEEEIPCIFEILINISSIKVQPDDGLPTMICTKCIDKAHSSYKFQQQCNRSQVLLDSYIEQLQELSTVEDVSITVNSEIISLDEIADSTTEMTEKMDDSSESDILPPELKSIKLESINDNDLLTDEPETVDNDDCDDLKNCIPLGEDTVDQLIKDNLQVDNLELISPKIRAFSLDLKTENPEPPLKANVEKPKEPPNMNYYKQKRADGTVEYECNLCSKIYKYANNLRIHVKTHDEEKPYVCTECKKGFKTYRSLIHHTRSHSGEQPYECKLCYKKYKQSSTLTAHMRIHTGTKPFLCSICGRGFRQAPDLTYHMRTHTKEKPYMCNVCGKTMTMQCHLVQHMRSHTGEKPFKCPECDKAFPSSTRLKRHSITHTTLKPFTCHICDKSFNRSSSLRGHTKTHLGVRSHVCSVCNKGFLWAHSLKTHLLTHSKETPGEVKSDNIVDKEPQSEPELNLMPRYAAPSAEKSLTNESFAIYSSSTSLDNNSSSDGFQIYSVASTNQDGVETFTLYSADSNTLQSSINSSTIQLSAVSL